MKAPYKVAFFCSMIAVCKKYILETQKMTEKTLEVDMPNYELIPDHYNEIAIIDDRQFELRGDGLAVPLHFRPDASALVHEILVQPGEFTSKDLYDKPAFTEVCDGTYPQHRFASVISDLRFTFTALGSRLIQIRRVPPNNVYSRNPSYKVSDERPLTTEE